MKRFFVPPVPPSGLRWHFLHSPFFTFSNLTGQLLLPLFSFYKEKLKRHRSWWMARDRLIYGCYCFFRWPLLKVLPADTINHKGRQLQISPQPSLVSTSCQNAITGPYPGQPSFPLWIKDTGAEVGKDKHLALPPLFSRFTLSLLQCVLFFPPLPSPAFICQAGLDGKSSGEV